MLGSQPLDPATGTTGRVLVLVLVLVLLPTGVSVLPGLRANSDSTDSAVKSTVLSTVVSRRSTSCSCSSCSDVTGPIPHMTCRLIDDAG